MIEKIFNDAKDKNVAATVIYVDSDGYSYDDPSDRADGASAIAVDEADMYDLFVKGVIIVDANGVLNKPVAYSEDAGFVLYTAPAEEEDSPEDSAPESPGT